MFPPSIQAQSTWRLRASSRMDEVPQKTEEAPECGMKSRRLMEFVCEINAASQSDPLSLCLNFSSVDSTLQRDPRKVCSYTTPSLPPWNAPMPWPRFLATLPPLHLRLLWQILPLRVTFGFPRALVSTQKVLRRMCGRASWPRASWKTSLPSERHNQVCLLASCSSSWFGF